LLDFSASTGRSLRPSESQRRTSIDIEKWLKNKFRQGFQEMRAEFRRGDQEKTGKVIPICRRA